MGLEHRTDYDWATLVESDAPADPYELFARWLADAEAAGEPEFNSMAVATVADGQPTVRNVLLRGVDTEGHLQFFTNRGSRKGVELAAEPRVGLLFSWLGIHRQIRIDATAVPAPDDVSDEYFATRPRQSRIGAWASRQSNVLVDRAELESQVAAVERRFGDRDVDRPPDWGGYLVTPTTWEFWQGRPNRLHDRLRYRRDPEWSTELDAVDSEPGAGWVRERLSP